MQVKAVESNPMMMMILLIFGKLILKKKPEPNIRAASTNIQKHILNPFGLVGDCRYIPKIIFFINHTTKTIMTGTRISKKGKIFRNSNSLIKRRIPKMMKLIAVKISGFLIEVSFILINFHSRWGKELDYDV